MKTNLSRILIKGIDIQAISLLRYFRHFLNWTIKDIRKLDHTDLWNMHKPECGEKIIWDFEIQTNLSITVRRPDLVNKKLSTSRFLSKQITQGKRKTAKDTQTLQERLEFNDNKCNSDPLYYSNETIQETWVTWKSEEDLKQSRPDFLWDQLEYWKKFWGANVTCDSGFRENH